MIPGIICVVNQHLRVFSGVVKMADTSTLSNASWRSTTLPENLGYDEPIQLYQEDLQSDLCRGPISTDLPLMTTPRKASTIHCPKTSPEMAAVSLSDCPFSALLLCTPQRNHLHTPSRPRTPGSGIRTSVHKPLVQHLSSTPNKQIGSGKRVKCLTNGSLIVLNSPKVARGLNRTLDFSPSGSKTSKVYCGSPRKAVSVDTGLDQSHPSDFLEASLSGRSDTTDSCCDVLTDLGSDSNKSVILRSDVSGEEAGDLSVQQTSVSQLDLQTSPKHEGMESEGFSPVAYDKGENGDCCLGMSGRSSGFSSPLVRRVPVTSADKDRYLSKRLKRMRGSTDSEGNSPKRLYRCDEVNSDMNTK